MAAMKVHSSDILRVSESLNTCSQGSCLKAMGGSVLIDIHLVFERERKIKRARIDAADELKDDAHSVLDKSEATTLSTGAARDQFEKQFKAEVNVIYRTIGKDVNDSIGQPSVKSNTIAYFFIICTCLNRAEALSSDAGGEHATE